MSRLAGNVWIRALSIGLALSVPAVVMAARVTFAPSDVLTLDRLNGVANRTVDKGSVYSNASLPLAVGDGAAATVFAECTDASDVLLNCSCDGNGSTQQVLHNLRVINNDRATPNAIARCICNVVGSGAAATRAVATCLELP
jgi:hypothetical protein